jgi:hypothetical protein
MGASVSHPQLYLISSYLTIRASCYDSGPAAMTYHFFWRPGGSGKRSFPWKASLSSGEKIFGKRSLPLKKFLVKAHFGPLRSLKGF